MPAKRKKSEKYKGLSREFLITVVIALVVVGAGLAYSVISKSFKNETKEAEVYVVAPGTPTPVPQYTEVKLGTCEFSVGAISNSNCIQAVRARCKDRNQNMVFDSNWINTTSCRGKKLCYTMTDLGKLFNRVTPDMVNRFRNAICQP